MPDANAPQRFIINGKFLRAESTGVHRVALELANALADLKDEHHPAVSDCEFEIWYPRDGSQRATSVRLLRRCVPFLTGIAWEQITLPLAQGTATLLNLCNIGPIASANAVTMIHDAQVHLSPASYRRGFRLWYRLIQPILGRRNRRILTVSEFSKTQISKLGLCQDDRIGVVHNGADHILHVEPDRSAIERLKLRPQDYVIALASTQAHKNIPILLAAFFDLRLAGVKLVLFGGTAQSEFESQGYPIPPNAVFAGRVSDGELRGLLAEALCLAFPSTTEGFGLPPLEAMLVGCPVLVAPCGSLPEVCGDAARYVDADDALGWATAISDIAAQPALRASLIAKGLAHAKKFTWRNAALALVLQIRPEH